MLGWRVGVRYKRASSWVTPAGALSNEAPCGLEARLWTGVVATRERTAPYEYKVRCYSAHRSTR